MRTPLRLALGITSALVLGALTATIASGFASSDAATPIAAPGTTVVDAPVLAPASVDGVSTLPSSENPLSLPDAIGQVRVVQPDPTEALAAIEAGLPLPTPPLPADILAATAALDAGGGDTPETPGIIADAAASATGADEATPDDPCADPATDPTTCPDGIHSAIFADTYHEPLEMWVVPAARTNHAGVSVWCDGAAPGAGELWLDVATNIPAAIHARYWPASDPTDVHELDIADIPSEVAAWQAEIDRTGTYTPRSYIFQHCALMTGLAPDTTYVVSAYAVDTFDRISAPEEATFSSAGEPTIPTMFALPLGQSLLYVAVPYVPVQGEPTMVIAPYAPGTEAPSCDDPSLRSTIGWANAPQSYEMSATYLNSHHYVSSFRMRYSGILNVPEGTNVVICAIWYDPDAASFALSTPLRYETLLASSPDTAMPVFTLDSVRTVRHLDQASLLILGSSVSGNICGQWNGPVPGFDAFHTIPIDMELCNGAAGYGTGSTVGFEVTSYYLPVTGDRISHSSVIRMPSTLCTGPGCDLPPDATYNVNLPTITVGTGLCGSSFGADCTPPTRETSLGVATISVHWVEGATNGNTAWAVGDAAEVTPTLVLPDAPQFDTYEGWVPSLSTDGLTGSATARIRADRPVNYTITLSGDCWTGAPPAPVTGRAARAEGTSFTSTASVTGLCPGSTYASTIELVDDAGHRTLSSRTYPTASIEPTTFREWVAGYVTIPQAQLEVTARVQVLHSYPWTNDWWIAGADLSMGAESWPYTAHFDETCHAAADNNIDGAWRPVTIPVTESIHLESYSRFGIEGFYDGHPGTSRCDWDGLSNFEARVAADVTPAQLLRGILLEADFYQTGIPSPGIRGHLYVWVTATRVPR